MKQSRTVIQYLELIAEANLIGLTVEPLYNNFIIKEGVDCICVTDDLDVVANYLRLTKHYNNEAQVAP